MWSKNPTPVLIPSEGALVRSVAETPLSSKLVGVVAVMTES